MRNSIYKPYKKSIILLFCSLAMLALSLLQAQDGPIKGIALSGRVTLQGSEEGLGGVRILAINGHMDEFADVLAVTNQEGRYEMLLPEGWSGFLLPDKTGFNFDPPRRDYAQLVSNHDGQNFVAIRDPEIVIITGKVKRPEGEGIANVRVTAQPIDAAGESGGGMADGGPMGNGGNPGDPTDPNNSARYTFTNEEGRYSLGVPKGWTGRVFPVKEMHRFEPEERLYEDLQVGAVEGQNFVGVKQGPYVISGRVMHAGTEEGIAGVRVLGVSVNGVIFDDGLVITNDKGRFEAELPHGWTGILRPKKLGFHFDPEQRSYENLSASIDGQTFFGARDESVVLISGRVKTASDEGIPGVYVWADILTPPPPENGDNTDPTFAGNFSRTDERGRYQLTVPQGWSGSVTPYKENFEFDPASRVYEDSPTGDLVEQDFVGIKREPVVLSGRVVFSGTEEGVAKVRIYAVAGDPTAADSSPDGYLGPPIPMTATNEKGRYEIQLPYGWTGSLAPEKQYLIFDPSQRDYENLTASKDGQNFAASRDPEIVLISGRVTNLEGHGLRNVSLFARSPNDDDPTVGDDGTATGSGEEPPPPGDGSNSPAGSYARTDESGYYQIALPVGWFGTVTPYRNDFRFDPTERTYTALEAGDLSDQNFVGSFYIPPPVEISGRVALATGEGIEGVVIVPSGIWYADTAATGEHHNPLDDYRFNPEIASVTDAEGRYEIRLPNGWSGSLTPLKDFYTFNPSSKVYGSDLVSPLTEQNFIGAKTPAIEISGTVRNGEGGPIAGAAIIVSHPMRAGENIEAGSDDPASPYFLENEILTDGEGHYSLEVPEGWSGRIGPYKQGFAFVPSHQLYTAVTADLADQDFVGSSNSLTISGRILTSEGQGLAGVILNGSDGIEPVRSNEKGFYTLPVPINRKLRVIPRKEGYAFDPASRDYAPLESDQTEQNYTASITDGKPVLDFLEDISDGHVRIRWNHEGDDPLRFFALTWDLYTGKWVERENDDSIWHGFDPDQNTGDLKLGSSGAYYAWITNLNADGSVLICDNPAAFIMNSGIPHKPLDVTTAASEGGKVQVSWKPDIYGSWLYWTIVYDINAGQFIRCDGPLGENRFWHYTAFGSDDFAAGTTELTLPSGGRYWIFLAAMSWDAKTRGEFETIYSETP